MREAAEGASGEDEEEVKDEIMGGVRVVVGIEADVGAREDWADWYPRPVRRLLVHRSLAGLGLDTFGLQ